MAKARRRNSRAAAAESMLDRLSSQIQEAAPETEAASEAQVPAMPPAAMEEIPAAEAGPPDLESLISQMETSLDGLEPKKAEEVRAHLNAIREIVADAGSVPETATQGPEEAAEGASAGETENERVPG